VVEDDHRAGTAGSQVPRSGSEQISHTYDCDGRLVSLQDCGGAKVTYVQLTQFGRLVVRSVTATPTPTPIVPGHQVLTMAASGRGDRDTTAPPHPPSPWPCDQTELATTRLPACAPQHVEDWHIGGGGY
jgi:hypothetical protein